MTTDVQAHTNGHRQKGRAAPLPAFTLPDSGITVGVRRFSPDLQDTIARAYTRDHPPPEPPMVESAIEGELEPNAADPDYEQALNRYFQGVTTFVSQKMIELAFDSIVIQESDEEVKETVSALRAQMDKIGAPIDPDLDDRAVYTRFIAINSTYDLTCLIAYLQRRSLPAEVAVQEFLESFQRQV